MVEAEGLKSKLVVDTIVISENRNRATQGTSTMSFDVSADDIVNCALLYFRELSCESI
jgi:hypothetical protein